MTTCPNCDDIRIVRIKAKPFKDEWHISCKCGNAWNWSSAFAKKADAKRTWENFMNEWYLHNSMKEEIQNESELESTV